MLYNFQIHHSEHRDTLAKCTGHQWPCFSKSVLISFIILRAHEIKNNYISVLKYKCCSSGHEIQCSIFKQQIFLTVNTLGNNTFHLDVISWKPRIVSINCNKVSIIREVLITSINEM